MLLRQKPRGLLRAALKVPVSLYRLHLGWLVGHRFLLLTHRGRRTGLLRQTVLEVISYAYQTHESVVVAAWGDRSDWYRNIETSPALEVQTGGQRYVPQYRCLGPDEVSTVLTAFERNHPWEAWLARRLLEWQDIGTEAGRRDLAQTIALVAFTPATSV